MDERTRQYMEIEKLKRIADLAEKSSEQIAALKSEVISVRLQNDSLQSGMDEIKESLARLLASSRRDAGASEALEEANAAQRPGRKPGGARAR